MVQAGAYPYQIILNTYLSAKNDRFLRKSYCSDYFTNFLPFWIAMPLNEASTRWPARL